MTKEQRNFLGFVVGSILGAMLLSVIVYVVVQWMFWGIDLHRIKNDWRYAMPLFLYTLPIGACWAQLAVFSSRIEAISYHYLRCVVFIGVVKDSVHRSDTVVIYYSGHLIIR